MRGSNESPRVNQLCVSRLLLRQYSNTIEYYPSMIMSPFDYDFLLLHLTFPPRSLHRDPEDAMLEAAAAANANAPDGHYLTLAELLRMPANAPFYPGGRLALPSDEYSSTESLELPKNHPVRLMGRANASTGNEDQFVRVGRSLSDAFLKRREFEQDLDNGDTNDFLRRPY